MKILTVVRRGHYLVAFSQLVSAVWRNSERGQEGGVREDVTRGTFLLSADVEIKLDGEGFVLPLTADEDVHRR